ncbi:helix-turn-helix transcriptional regulator [Streptomyces sp. NPDC087297]|uniref:helix-turn-helix transcriptional regulator n=1 Tax=Streptomyces sp. NPDC087297 TaxID=3365778 RepID=UPI003830C681
MIETDPDYQPPTRTYEDSRHVIRTASEPAAMLRVLIQRRQALLHQEPVDLKSLHSYARRLPQEPATHPGLPAGLEILTGTDSVAARLDTVLGAAETEVLILDRTAHTPDEPGYEEAGATAGYRIRSLLQRGIVVRTVTDRRGTDFPAKAKELIALTELGLQARIGPRLPTGLVLVDRRVCLILPSGADGTGADEEALMMGEFLLHRMALPLFESLWARATPIGRSGSPLTADQRELLGLLVSGLKDESIARRLGVHVHTARRRITRMLQELDADTRFQAGAQAAIRGWLHPAPDPDDVTGATAGQLVPRPTNR